MVGGAGLGIKAAVVLGLLSGCFWHSYGRQAATHTDVLVGIARKGVDLATVGRLTAETMPELTYPLERAEAFAQAAAARATPPPPSLTAFETLVARYRELVDAIDRARRDHSVPPGEQLAQPLAAVEAAAETVRAALHAEGRL
jgi:hypothetical protein